MDLMGGGQGGEEGKLDWNLIKCIIAADVLLLMFDRCSLFYILFKMCFIDLYGGFKIYQILESIWD